jgi:hypothetical protein
MFDSLQNFPSFVRSVQNDVGCNLALIGSKNMGGPVVQALSTSSTNVDCVNAAVHDVVSKESSFRGSNGGLLP